MLICRAPSPCSVRGSKELLAVLNMIAQDDALLQLTRGPFRPADAASGSRPAQAAVPASSAAALAAARARPASATSSAQKPAAAAAESGYATPQPSMAAMSTPMDVSPAPVHAQLVGRSSGSSSGSGIGSRRQSLQAQAPPVLQQPVQTAQVPAGAPAARIPSPKGTAQPAVAGSTSTEFRNNPMWNQVRAGNFAVQSYALDAALVLCRPWQFPSTHPRACARAHTQTHTRTRTRTHARTHTLRRNTHDDMHALPRNTRMGTCTQHTHTPQDVAASPLVRSAARDYTPILLPTLGAARVWSEASEPRPHIPAVGDLFNLPQPGVSTGCAVLCWGGVLC